MEINEENILDVFLLVYVAKASGAAIYIAIMTKYRSMISNINWRNSFNIITTRITFNIIGISIFFTSKRPVIKNRSPLVCLTTPNV